MKKLIVTILSFVFILLGSQNALASGNLFNGQAEDCSPAIGIGNVTTGNVSRDSYGCWKNTSVTASAGDTINVAMYYHNSTNATLTGVRAAVSKSSSGPANSYSFTGTMYSDQGNQTIGTVTLNLTSSQTLTYSSTHLMKGEADVLADRDTLVVQNEGGINIGTATTAWTDYGTVIFVYKVGNTVNDTICRDTTASNYGGTLPCVYQTICRDPAASNYGSYGSCVYPSVCKDTTASNYGGTLPCVYKTICRDPSASNYGSYGACVYQTICRDPSASNYGSHGSCIYNNNTCRITRFDADDTSIEEGDSTVLRWSTENCNSVSISDIGGVSKNGSQRVEPNYTRTYTIKAYGNNGSDSDSVKIYVDENNNDNYDYNTPSAKTYSPKNVDTNSATLYGYVSGNGSRINSWFEFPCYGTKYGQKYNQTSGNITANVYSLSSNRTYSYCAVAQNVSTGKTVRGNTVSFTTEGGYVAPTNNCAVTTVATNIGQTNAQLNGLITGGNGGNSYFEYGTSVNLGQRTNSRYVNGNVNFNEFVSGLSSNTIYYFRMVSDCGDGLSYGSTEVFRTDTVQTVGTVTKTVYVKQGTTVIGEKSPVLLTISNKYKMIAAGDLVDYVVTYKNIGNVTLLKPMVQVVLPTNMTLVNSSRGTYSIDTHTLSAQVEDLAPGQEGAIYLQAKVDSIPLNNSNIPTTAIFIYTSTTGSQENAMAYVVNNPLVDTSGTVVVDDTNSTLGGAALFGSMGSIGLVGWLIIILIILVLILIVRSVYDRNPSGPTPHGPAH